MLIFAAIAAGCQSGPAAQPADTPGAGDPPAHTQPDRPVAYLNGQPLTQADLFAVLAEMDGGLALSEVLLDRAIADRLRDQGLTLTDADLQRERSIILGSLSDNEDEATRLLDAMRERRGLGDRRFAALLRRNAGLRKLIDPNLVIGEPAIQQAYDLRYGTRYVVRLILTDNAAQAQEVRRLALDGASFIDLAVQASTDPSAAQGGLLSPINPADATYPLALREQLPKLKLESEAARLSPVLTLGTGYALVRLEEIYAGRGPAMETVRDELEAQVRLRLQRLRMEQLARTLIDSATIVVLDPTLKQSWEQQRGGLDQAVEP